MRKLTSRFRKLPWLNGIACEGFHRTPPGDKKVGIQTKAKVIYSSVIILVHVLLNFMTSLKVRRSHRKCY